MESYPPVADKSNGGDPVKFSQMKYQRPDLASLKEQIQSLTAQLRAAELYVGKGYVSCKRDAVQAYRDQSTLASIRHTIDTRDTFYDDEVKFWNGAEPQLEEDLQQWTMAMLESPYRKDFEAEYGDLMFVNAEIQLKTFAPEIMADIQKENDLTQEYEKLLASAQIPFEGKVYTISQMSPFKTDADDARRLAAWKAEGQWYKDNQAQLMTSTISWCICGIRWARSWATKAIPRWAITGWAGIAIPRRMWRNFVLRCAPIWYRWQTASTGSRPSGWGRNIP